LVFDAAIGTRLDPGETAMTLPWKPIAELPVAPDEDTDFAFGAKDCRPSIARWIDDRWHFDVFHATRKSVMDSFTHFIEITPP
jgi:hypothetical protein